MRTEPNSFVPYAPPKTFFVYKLAFGRNDGSEWVHAFTRLPAVLQAGCLYIERDPLTGAITLHWGPEIQNA